MSLILGLDTSSRHVSMALSRHDQILIETNFVTRDELSATLVPTISFVFRSIGASIEDVDLFGIGVGPGLFTGLRVGLSTLKGFLVSAPRPVVPVVTLEALAWKLRQSRHILVPLIDARRDEVYMAVYRFTGQGEPEEIRPPILTAVKDLPRHLAGLEGYRFTGNGVAAYRGKLSEMFPGFRSRGRSSFLATEICRIAAWRHGRGEAITRPQDLRPLYLRPPDAEAGGPGK